MSPHLDFSFGFGPGGRRKEPGESTRILVLGDFSGRSSRGEVEPLGNRKPRKVDLDTFDDVFAMLAPQLRLDVSPDLTVTITPREIDDLHPDAIFQSVSAFDELRTLRARLADPKTFADAARTLGGGAGSSSAGGTSAPSASESAPASAPDATSAGAPPGGEASSGDGLTEFQRLLGGTGGNRSPGAGGAGATGGASSRGDRSARRALRRALQCAERRADRSGLATCYGLEDATRVDLRRGRPARDAGVRERQAARVRADRRHAGRRA